MIKFFAVMYKIEKSLDMVFENFYNILQSCLLVAEDLKSRPRLCRIRSTS